MGYGCSEGEHGLDRRRTLKVEGMLCMAQELGELVADEQGIGNAGFQQEGA